MIFLRSEKLHLQFSLERWNTQANRSNTCRSSWMSSEHRLHARSMEYVLNKNLLVKYVSLDFSNAICVLYERKISLGGICWISLRWTNNEVSCWSKSVRGQWFFDGEMENLESQAIQYGYCEPNIRTWRSTWRCFLEYSGNHFQSW